MIISASRRTDIPAFYSEWFINRIREGYLYVQNPFNAHKYTKVGLSPEAVDVIVFWTKNPQPMLKYLDELQDRNFRFYFQFTLTGYPSDLEPSVPEVEEVLSTFKALSNKIGSDKVVWRYDPIIISDATSEDFVLSNFEQLARKLNNFTRRVVISFADYYKKVTNNFNKLKSETGIQIIDISHDIKKINKISEHLAKVARNNGLQIFSCAEKYDLSDWAIKHGKCIDDELINKLFGYILNIDKDKYQRDECGCITSRDIGQYNTCIHDCVYCYANYNKNLARRNKSLHDPQSPFLIKNNHVPHISKEKMEKGQLSLLEKSSKNAFTK